ncbi:MAG: YegS/Rv2252/BmrU family lipid kinase [Myxococcales bacterium]|nr:YegS/Rv2252/BmrU family lipid kinase [Myxococcales bacterium]USN49835.1 MAG: YegS/Rv2252/BmrU family lipid kinase [Myxococcales bacterium]
MKKSLAFIINPASAFGKTKKKIKAILKEVKEQRSDAEIFETYHPLHAISLTKEALKNGSERIVVVGGDGTLNEVVNGFFDQNGELINKNASLAIIPSGSGSDFVRNLPQKENLSEAVDFAINGQESLCDVGFIEAKDANSKNISRYFINVSSIGLSGLVAGFMRTTTRKFGPTAAYFMSTVKAIKALEPQTIVISDEHGVENMIPNCSLVSFANGKFYGSGMKIAPMAKLDDGLFDVIAIKDLSVGFFLMNGYRVYQGTHLELDNVNVSKVSSCYVRSLGNTPVYIETDGELFAQLPAQFSVKKRILAVVKS